MANICVLKKITKLQKLPLNNSIQLIIANRYSQLLRTRSCTQNSSQKLNLKNNLNVEKFITLNGFHNKNHLKYWKNLTTSTNNNDTINEFRAREEEKEKEYSKQEPPPSSSSSSSEQDDDEKIKKENLIKNQILDESLKFVQTYGWSTKSIQNGAIKMGYPGTVHGLFPNGQIVLIRYFYNKSNQLLVDYMIKETNDGEKIPENPIEFIINVTKIRLQMIEPYLDHWPQALAIMTLPKNTATSLAQLLTLVDDICYYSGDRSADFGWYTRRIGLASIYKMTELYMLKDSSVNHENTWKFLKQRMEDALSLQSFLLQSDDTSKNIQRSFNTAFVTARNILGLGYNRR